MSAPAHHPAAGWRALARRPGYPGFVVTVGLTRVASGMFATAGILLVLDRTGSAALAGTVSAASVIPGALLGPWLGAWLDVARRRRVLIVADQLLSVAALVALLALAGHGPEWTLPLVGAAYGLTRPFSVGSFTSALSALAGPELLDRASTIEATSLNLGIVLGPAFAAVIAGLAGPGRAVELQGILTLVVAVAIAWNPSFEARTHAPSTSVREAMRVGTHALFGHRVLREVSAGSLLANFSWGMMFVSFPLYAAGALHGARSDSGYLWAAIALGSIVGTFALAGSPSRRRIGISAAAVGLSALLWLLAHSLLAGIGLIALTGFVEGPFYSGTIALRQRLAPGAARGQVMNTLTSFGMLAASAGSLLGGLLADPRTTFLVFCAANLLGAVIAGGRDPEPVAGGGAPARG